MKIKEMAWFNTPWIKIKERGIESLDDGELLSVIFVRGGSKGSSIELSNKLLKNKNLNQFEDASFHELKKILGETSKIYQVMALGELFKRYSKLKNNGFVQKINNSKDVFNLLHDELKQKKKEYLYLILLDTKSQIIKKKIVSIGTLNMSLIHPREIFKEAIKESAASFILVHNHPSGDPTPSYEDEIITKRIEEIGEMIGVELVDHVIIGSGKWYSFNDKEISSL